MRTHHQEDVYPMKIPGSSKLFMVFLLAAGTPVWAAAPDLVVQSPTVSPGSVAPGATLSAACAVKNIGDRTASGSAIKYYLSSDPRYSSSDTFLLARLVPSLAAGKQSSQTAELTLPVGTALGTWYILFRADANGVITESNETNNVSSRQITVTRPDLVVQSPAVSPSAVRPGSSISLSCSVKNNGAVRAAPSSLKYYLSRDSKYDGSDTFLGVADRVAFLEPGASLPEDATATLPAGTSAGTWYVLFRADALDEIAETNETNNVASRQITVTGPDLTVSSISLGTGTAPPGGTVPTSCTVKNAGDAFSAASTLKYYLSSNSSWDGNDLFLGAVDRVGSLDPGQSGAEAADLVIPSGTSPGSWYILCRADANEEIVESNEGNNTRSAALTVSSGSPFRDLPTSHWAYPAALYLYQKGLLQPDANGNVRPNDSILRAELAKLAFLGAEIPPLAENFPNPFNDLQERNAQTEWYYSYSKNLSYLEFGDGVSPFRRDRFNFYPSATITRAHSLKVLVETWNLPLRSSGSLPYSDVPSSHDAYHYVLTAYQRGLIDGQQSRFRPDDVALRAEGFVMLYNLMSVQKIPSPDVERADFFTAGNYTPANLGSRRSLVNGNFRHLTRTSFEIPGIRLPLLFAHAYNSYLTELPEQLFPVRPLGHGWTHTFNSYVLPVDDHLIVFWPDGRLHVYRSDASGVVAVTKGVYDTLTSVSSTQYTIRKKNQIVFTYEKLPGSAADFPFVLTRITDRNGNQLTLAYEPAARSGWRRLKTVTDFAGRTLTFTYHSGSDLIRDVTDPISRQIAFDYDAYGAGADLATFRDAKQQTTRYTYNTATPERHLLLTVTLPRGNTITNTYEERKLRSTKQGTRPAVQLSYQRNYDGGASAGYVVTDVTEMGRVFQVSTSRDDTVGRMSGPAGFLATYEYGDARHPMLPTRIVGADGVQLDLTYDARGNIQRIDRPLAVTERFVYTPASDLLQYTDPRGKDTRFSYDAQGNLLSVQDPLDRVTSFSWDARGLLTSASNPAGVTFTFSYDAYGNRTGVSAPLGISTSATYDAAGRLLTATDPRDLIRKYTYDANDNLLSMTDLFTTSYGYDGNDNPTSVTNAKGGVTSWTYNPEDLLEAMEFQGARTAYSYYEDGLLSQSTDPDGQSITYQYDDLGRLVSNSEGNEYIYDARGNLASATNSLGKVTFGYDALNRLTSTTDMFNQTVAYEYDKAGNVVKITYPGGKEVLYTYHDDGRLRSVEDWMSGRTLYSYHPDGRIASITYPNAVTTTYSHDSLGRLIEIETRGNSGVISAFTYGFDDGGNLLAIESTGSPQPDPGSLKSSHMVYDAANRLIELDGRTVEINANGNTARKGQQIYRFDRANRLREVAGGSLNLQFDYDALGLRRGAAQQGEERHYVLDPSPNGERILMEILGGEPTHYVHGLGLLSRIDAQGERRYFHFDHLGNVVAVTDDSQSVTHRYSYWPYGSVAASIEEDFNPFRFVGQFGVMYETPDLYFMRARYYDPEVGRFISHDPIWSENLYLYAIGNPLRWTDPSGRCITHRPMFNIYCQSLIEIGFDQIRRHGIGVANPVLEKVGRRGGGVVGMGFSGVEIYSAHVDGGMKAAFGQAGVEAAGFLTALGAARMCAPGGFLAMGVCAAFGDEIGKFMGETLRMEHVGVMVPNDPYNDPYIQALRQRSLWIDLPQSQDPLITW